MFGLKKKGNKGVLPAHKTKSGLRTGAWACSHSDAQVGISHIQCKSSIQGHSESFILGKKDMED